MNPFKARNSRWLLWSPAGLIIADGSWPVAPSGDRSPIVRCTLPGAFLDYISVRSCSLVYSEHVNYVGPNAINWDSQVLTQVLTWAIFLSPILFAIGMMGLRTRYRTSGGFLLFGAVVGGIVTLIGTLGQMFAPVYSVSATYFGVWFGGAYILFFCLTLFGINALVEKPLPRWNALPLLSGLWVAIGPLLNPLLSGIGRVSFEAFLIIDIAGFVVMAAVQIMLGFILQADASQGTVTT